MAAIQRFDYSEHHTDHILPNRLGDNRQGAVIRPRPDFPWNFRFGIVRLKLEEQRKPSRHLLNLRYTTETRLRLTILAYVPTSTPEMSAT